MNQPQFTTKMTVSTFQKYCWYKNELVAICQKYHLPTYGTKYELVQYIISFLEGKSAIQIKPLRKKQL
ncbi:SAP domain-containing protein [Bombilactobacillus thymidiniphilus]|uniref:SAP domain-containing protein n=1 Tax=Bombilactobacillus thymidiniphilus TaxID=2923363 RepID=A0ABY4PDA1_9LACO|nr:SAP domain-containing protein [Bombilactobacillus thymidiniphilus]UQS83590.1 SAP domain-containing protein [Bombilactobacillus thymidiniphilus]